MKTLPLPNPPLPRRSRLRLWLKRAHYEMTVTRPQRKLSRPCEALMCALILAVLAAILFPVFVTPRSGSGKSCPSNLKHIGNAIQMYAADWDERLPRGDAWVDCTLAYTSATSSVGVIKIYDCTQFRQSSRIAYSYAYNDMLDDEAVSGFVISATVPLCYDTRQMVRNAHAPGRSVLAVPPRHGSSITTFTNFMVFLDGHTGRVDAQGKVIKPELNPQLR